MLVGHTSQLVASAIAIALVATACGGDGPGAATSEPGAETSAPADQPTEAAVTSEPAAAGGGHRATVTIGDETFELTSTGGDDVCEGFVEEQLFFATWEDGPLSLFVNLDGDSGSIQLADDVDRDPTFTWVADNGQTPLVNAENTSTIDAVDFTETAATGSASFIDVVEANRGPTETVPGTFEIACAS